MADLAWTGVGIVVALLIISIIVWLVGLISHPIGRAIVLGWCIIGAVAWGVAGGIYLLWTHGG